MKKILLGLLAVVLVLGLFGGVGYAGYRFGYAQGVQTTAQGDVPGLQLRPFDNMRPRGMDNFGWDRGFQRGFGPGRFPMRGFGFFSPVLFLGWITVLALFVWFIYWLFARSGWRLTRQTTESAAPTQTEPPPQSENE